MTNCSRRCSSLERSSRDGKIQRPLLNHRRPVPVRRRQRRRNDGSSSLWTNGKSGCNTTLIKDRSGRHANLRYPGRNPVQQGDERFPHLGNACLLGRHPKAGGLADVSTSRENGIASSQDGEPGETKMSRTHPFGGGEATIRAESRRPKRNRPRECMAAPSKPSFCKPSNKSSRFSLARKSKMQKMRLQGV